MAKIRGGVEWRSPGQSIRNLTNRPVYQEQPDLGQNLRNGHLDPYYPTGGTLTNLDACGNLFDIATLQATAFQRDPTNSTKFTFSVGIPTARTYNGVTLNVNAKRDADESGGRAATANASVTGLTLIKQP